MNKLDESVICEYVFPFLEKSFRYRTISRLSRSFRQIVYRPENNGIVSLDFTKIYDVVGDYSAILARAPSVNFFYDRKQQKRFSTESQVSSAANGSSDECSSLELLHQKLWNTFAMEDLFGEGKIFSQIKELRIKFKIDQIFNRELAELVGFVREMESVRRIELISPPVDFVIEMFLDRKITDCYCLDEENINCVDEKLENPEGENFLINLEQLWLQDVEIDTMTKIFNYNIFLKLKNLKEIFFNDIYSIKTSTASILSGSTPQSRSMSFDESSVVSGGGGLDQVSFTSNSLLSPGPSPPAQLVMNDPFQFPPPVSQDVIHNRIEKIDLYMIPFNETLNFIKINFLHNFPNLKILRIRCLSSAKHASLLADVFRYKFIDSGLPSLEEIEIGFLNSDFIRFIVDVCEPNALRKLSVTSRIDLSGSTIADELYDFGQKFSHLSELNLRINKNSQLEELIEFLANSSFFDKIEKIKLTWNLINSIELDTLVRFRDTLNMFGRFIVSSSSLLAERKGPRKIYTDAFERYYWEFCEQRVYCECEDCLDEREEETGVENEEHLRRIAREEWNIELSLESREILNSL